MLDLRPTARDPRRLSLRALAARLVLAGSSLMHGAYLSSRYSSARSSPRLYLPILRAVDTPSATCLSSPCELRVSSMLRRPLASDSKFDGSFITAILETAAVGVLFLALRSITEGSSSSYLILLPVCFVSVW
ncbi:hypothetical protein Hypma_014546 [Hypsizygus marmoreus]|uniref:Uncharacterized protein n=1 Tax=Hypsizygus marmoreus TaxID=39966 RepID=A0A369JBW4_HYPMA|nr:hypothetical protein Hypma_014546 [Hypsizygus marmoreus]